MTGSDAQPDDGQTLYRLLGLAPGVSRERLRHVYEWAVADASRRGDHQALLMLSRALDKLPDKSTIYPSASGRTVAAPLPTSSSAGGRPARRSRRGNTASRRRASVRGVLAYGVVIPGIVVVVVIAVIRSNATTVPATPIHQQLVITRDDPTQPTQPVTTASDLPSVPNRSSLIINPHAVIVVPRTAPTAPDGLARILCQPDGTTSGYLEAASRGSRVSCPNGATPRIVG